MPTALTAALLLLQAVHPSPAHRDTHSRSLPSRLLTLPVDIQCFDTSRLNSGQACSAQLIQCPSTGSVLFKCTSKIAIFTASGSRVVWCVLLSGGIAFSQMLTLTQHRWRSKLYSYTLCKTWHPAQQCIPFRCPCSSMQLSRPTYTSAICSASAWSS